MPHYYGLPHLNDIIDTFVDLATADKSTAGSNITSGTRMGGAKTPSSVDNDNKVKEVVFKFGLTVVS